MFFPVKMKKLSVIAAADYADDVTRVLLNAGTVDISEPKEYVTWEGVKARDVAIPQDRVRDIRQRIEGFLAMADENPFETAVLDTESMSAVKPENCDKVLDRLASDLQVIRESQKNLQQDLFRMEELKEQLEKMPQIARGIVPGESLYISIHTGVLKKIHKDAFLKALDSLNTMCKWEDQEGDSTFMVIVALKREEKSLDQLLERFHWTSQSLPAEAGASPDALLNELKSRIAECHEKQNKHKEEAKALILSRKEELLTLWRNVRVNELYDKVQLEFGETGRTILFTGWVPAGASEKVEKKLRSVCSENLFLEWLDVKDMKDLNPGDIPVELNNPGFLKPFQLLVENYSLPAYGTIDPTPFTAVSFFLMFGLMFGDAGQGLVIMLLGLLGSRLMKKDTTYRKLAQLIGWCGLSAIIFGVFFGSYFGFALFPPLWFDYHGIVTGHSSGNAYFNSVYDILGLTIRFGIVIIFTGLFLNWINLFRKREWIDLVLGRTGLLGGWIYGAGIYSAWIFVASNYKTLPDSNLLGWILGLPVILLFFREPLEAWHHKKPFKPSMIADFLMEGIVQILETFSGYLSNTLSFMRVAGLGIAHVSLMMAFAEMAGLTDSVIFRFLILLAGNILVIALEGLSAGIQSLRLNYYEFFSKYFTGSGRAFTPVSLGRRKTAEN
jgi:V/A-type H+-transporting ATPase subunit I